MLTNFDFLEEQGVDSISDLALEFNRLNTSYATFLSQGKQNTPAAKAVKQRIDLLKVAGEKWLEIQNALIMNFKEQEGIDTLDDLNSLLKRSQADATKLEKENKTTSIRYRNLVNDIERYLPFHKEWLLYDEISQNLRNITEIIESPPLPTLQRFDTEQLLDAARTNNITIEQYTKAKEWVFSHKATIEQELEDQQITKEHAREELMELIAYKLDELSQMTDKRRNSPYGQNLASSLDSLNLLQSRLDKLMTFESLTPPTIPSSPLPSPAATTFDPPYNLVIFHDAENCLIPKNAKPEIISQRTIDCIFASYLGTAKPIEGIKIHRDVNVTWNIVIKHDENNPYHPSTAFLNNLAMLGGRLISPPSANKSGSADLEIKSLISEQIRNFGNLSPSARAKMIYVLISGDKDFQSDIVAMTKAKMHNIIICNTLTNSSYMSLANAALPVWEQITDASVAAPTSPSRSTTNPTLSDEEIFQISHHLSTFVESKGGKIPASELGNFYKLRPELKSNIQAATVTKVCEKSSGVLVWEKGDKSIGYGYIVLTPIGKLYLFIFANGVRIPANRYGEFKRNHPELNSWFDNNNLKSTVESSTILEWLPGEKSVGYGFIQIKTSSLAAVPHSPISRPLLPRVFTGVSRPKYAYIKEYRDELERILSSLTTEIALKINNSSKVLSLESTITNEEIDKSLVESCVAAVESYLQLLHLETFVVEGVAYQELMSHKPLRDYIIQHHLFLFPFIKNTNNAAIAEEKEEDSLELFVQVKSVWFTRQKTKSITATSFFHYLKHEFQLSQFQVHEVDPRKKIFRVAFKKIQDRNYLFSSKQKTLSNGLVVFESSNLTPKQQSQPYQQQQQQPLESLNCTLVYRSPLADFEQKLLEVKGIIDSLKKSRRPIPPNQLFKENIAEGEEKELTLKEKGKIDYSKGKQSFFYQHLNYFAKILHEQFQVEISSNNSLSIFGRNQNIVDAISYLKEFFKSIPYKKIPTPDIEAEKLASLKKTIDSFYREKNQLKRPSRKSIEENNSGGISCYWFPNNINPTELVIVSLPHQREHFERLHASILKLLTDFASTTLENVLHKGSPRLPLAEIVSSFSLHSIKISHQNILLSGSFANVQNAKDYILGLLSGSILESREVSLPSKKKLTSLFLQLPALQSTLSNICADISSSFRGVIATLAKNLSSSAILILHGPKMMLADAVMHAQQALLNVENNVIEKILPLQQHQIDFILKSNTSICSDDPVLIQYPDDDDQEEDDGDNVSIVSETGTADRPIFIRGEASLGSLSIFVANCHFEDVGKVLSCDCIVNPANSNLQHSGGLARLIADSAGLDFTEACKRNIKEHGPMNSGEARAIPGYHLNRFGIRHVINLAAPALSNSNAMINANQRSTLRQVVNSALTIAESLQLSGIGIPGVGTGIFQWPVQIATYEIVKSITEWAYANNPRYLKQICLFDIDSTVVDGFFSALSTVNNPEIKSAAGGPSEAPVLYDYQWYRATFSHEPDYNSPASIPAPNHHRNVRLIPYDYDQTNTIEKAYSEGKDHCVLIGDYYGVKNGSTYSVVFNKMKQCNTQTTFERDVVRLPRTTIPPLYQQRLADYNARMEDSKNNLPKAEVTQLRELNSTFEALTIDENRLQEGIRLYGYPIAVEKAEGEIRGLLESGKRTGSINLVKLMKTINKSFASVVMELGEVLNDFNATIINAVENTSIEFEVLGDLTLLQVNAAAIDKVCEMTLNALTVPLPETWNQSTHDDTIQLVELQQHDNEYRQASDCFLRGFNANIIRIERVQNPGLYREYYKSKEIIAKKNNGNPNELLLKHGTRSTDPERIWNSGEQTNNYGFDPRFCEKGYFGRGAYFAEDTSYSDGYAYSLPNSNYKQMFLAWVLAGSCDQKTQIDSNIRHPTSPHDSVRGPITSSNQGIIIYELHRSYPAYLITYQK